MGEEGPRFTKVFLNEREALVEKESPIGVYLCKSNVYAFSKSFKFRRPRGVNIFDWWGYERIYTELGERINPYTYYPRADGEKFLIDHRPGLLGRVAWLFRRKLKARFYHGRFFRSKLGSRALWIALNRLPYPQPREGAGGGRASSVKVSADVLVVGGGLAGLTVASTVASKGFKVLLVEADDYLGGRLKLMPIHASTYVSWRDVLTPLVDEVRRGNVTVLLNTVFQGFLEDAMVGYDFKNNATVLFDAKRVVIATGCRDAPSVFVNNDLPKIFRTSGLLKLMKKCDVVPGKRCVLIGSSLLNTLVAIELRSKGVEVTIVDRNGGKHLLLTEAVERGAEYFDNVSYVEAKGKYAVEEVRIARGGEAIERKVDFVGVSQYSIPSSELAGQLDLRFAFDSKLGGFVPLHSLSGETEKEGVFIAGDAGGVLPFEATYYFSRAVGYKVCESLGRSLDEDYDKCIEEGTRVLKEHGLLSPYLRLNEAYVKGSPYSAYDESDVPIIFDGDRSRQFACICMDVLVEDLQSLYDELGVYKMEHVKRITGLSTGPCQGKSCAFSAVIVLASYAKKDPMEIGLPKHRFPVVPQNVASLGGVVA